jgi:glycosyltransferase involved in cell wall biosynthesis
MKGNFYIVGTTAHSLINFRYDLIKSLSKKYKVTALSQDTDKAVTKKLRNIKSSHFCYGKKKRILFDEIVSFYNVCKFFFFKKKISIISYTLRGNIFVGLSTLFKKDLNHIPMITGLGGIYLSRNENLFRNLIFKLVFILLNLIFFKSKKVIFQNIDDKKIFSNKNKKFIVIPGSGVDTKYFSKSNFPKNITFMMISRLVKFKGVESFLHLAKKITSKRKNVFFILVGKRQKDFSLNQNQINKFNKLKNIKIIPWIINPKILFKKCSVYILPSKREGMSRSILEAMSSGKPIITTNVPGCKQAIKNNYNGYLVKYNDEVSINKATEKFIKNKKLIKKFGNNSRKRAIKYFDINIINRKIINIIN